MQPLIKDAKFYWPLLLLREMSTVEERRKGLQGVAESLNTARFGVPEAPLAEIISRLEAKDSSLIVLDTRSEEERSVSTIPGSLSKAEFEATPGAFKDKEIVTFCTVGYLAGAYACDLRRNKGYEHVRNLGEGSLLGYTLAGRPLAKPDGTPATAVHTFMAGLAGLAGDGLETVAFEDADARLAAADTHIAATLSL